MSELRDGIAHAGSQGARIKQGNANPLVTFVLVAYNQERFIRQAVESALAQSYSPIQFIFSDDCSTDHTFKIMRDAAEKYSGNEQIILNCNEQNLGVVNHLNKIFIGMAAGKYFVPLAGDDISSPDRTEKVVDLFEATGASAVAVNPVMIDEEGRSEGKRFIQHFPDGVLGFEEYFVKGAPFFGGGGYARELFDVYGPMKSSARNEDQILPFRASIQGGIAYLNDPVFYYREHGKNMSYWVKMKREPRSYTRYYIAYRKNELQNVKNFKLEVQETYQGPDKSKIIARIEEKISRHQFELIFIRSRVFSRFVHVAVACREGRPFKQIIATLLICISPRLYRLVLAVKHTIR